MQLRGVDTNLIIALRALLAHQSVTRAAKEVGLGQSSMSHALARLRAHFGDPLLVPVGRQLVLTDRAKSLVGPVADAVARLEGVFARAEPFDPRTSRRVFRIGATDSRFCHRRGPCDRWRADAYLEPGKIMIVEYIRYRTESSQVNDFLGASEIASKSLQASPHCLGYELAQCAEARESFTLRILWDSAEGHLQGFRKGELFKPFLAAIQPFVENVEEMRHYEPTALRWSR